MKRGNHGMNRAIRLALVVNTLALMGASVSGKSRNALAPGQTISIRVYEHAQTPAGVLHSATDQASWLFRAAQIRISWEFPSTESPEDQGTDMTSAAFQQPDARPYIVVRLMRRTPATVFPGAMGYALPFAHAGAHVVIFYDRVETVADSSKTATYLVLGCAVAHEIGHVLLGSSDHATGTLMQAQWTSATWRLASMGLLAFTREQAERMGQDCKDLSSPHIASPDAHVDLPRAPALSGQSRSPLMTSRQAQTKSGRLFRKRLVFAQTALRGT